MEVCVVPSIGYGAESGHRELEQAAALLAGCPEIAAALNTHRFGIDEAPRALAVVDPRPPGTFKVVVHP